MHTVYLALGTNLGNRETNLQEAIKNFPPAISPEECSPIYETAPWGFSDQPAFLNQVVKAQTTLSPHKLLFFIKKLESQLGRQPTFSNGPRLIDIDILFYDDLILDTPELSLPHPRMQGRAFVWFPLSDLAPNLVHPLLGKTASQVRNELGFQGITLYAKASCK